MAYHRYFPSHAVDLNLGGYAESIDEDLAQACVKAGREWAKDHNKLPLTAVVNDQEIRVRGTMTPYYGLMFARGFRAAQQEAVI